MPDELSIAPRLNKALLSFSVPLLITTVPVLGLATAPPPPAGSLRSVHLRNRKCSATCVLNGTPAIIGPPEPYAMVKPEILTEPVVVRLNIRNSVASGLRWMVSCSRRARDADASTQIVHAPNSADKGMIT